MAKRQAKSSENIKAYSNVKPETFEVPDSFDDKENTPKDSRIKRETLS